MPMNDQEVAELKQQYNDLLQGSMAQRNAAMDEQVNLGAIIRAITRERDTLKTENAQLKETVAKLMATQLPSEAAPAALAAAAPALANGAAAAA